MFLLLGFLSLCGTQWVLLLGGMGTNNTVVTNKNLKSQWTNRQWFISDTRNVQCGSGSFQEFQVLPTQSAALTPCGLHGHHQKERLEVGSPAF